MEGCHLCCLVIFSSSKKTDITPAAKVVQWHHTVPDVALPIDRIIRGLIRRWVKTPVRGFKLSVCLWPHGFQVSRVTVCEVKGSMCCIFSHQLISAEVSHESEAFISKLQCVNKQGPINDIRLWIVCLEQKPALESIKRLSSNVNKSNKGIDGGHLRYTSGYCQSWTACFPLALMHPNQNRIFTCSVESFFPFLLHQQRFSSMYSEPLFSECIVQCRIIHLSM